MSLSKENFNKIIPEGIYKADYKEFPNHYYDFDPYHCKNWVFTPYIMGEDIYMMDTYFNDNDGIPLADNNIDKFKFQCLKDEIVLVSCQEWKLFDEKDKFYLPMDSGGRGEYGRQYWVRKGSCINKDLLINKFEEDKQTFLKNIDYIEKEIRQIKMGNSWRLKPKE